MKKVRIAMLLMVIGILLLSGCGKNSTSTFSPEQNSIFVTREGAISSALVEVDQKGHYDTEGLKTFIEGIVAEYNTKYGAERVRLASCTISDGKGIAIFDYSSGADLYEFTTQMEDKANQAANLMVSTVSQGLISGKVSDGTWIKAKDGSGVPLDTVTKQGDLTLISLEGAVTVQTEGKIQFYSGDITLSDDFTAVVAGGKAYIVFK